MQIGKLMLQEENIKRNLTPAKNGPLTYTISFKCDKAQDKPWPYEFSYSFLIEVGEDNGLEFVAQCSGMYALAFKHATEDELASSATYEVVWPFVRDDIVVMLSSVKLFPDIPYSVKDLRSSEDEIDKPKADKG